MKTIFSFNDYMLEMVSESIINDGLNLKLSDKLRSLLKTINHPIAYNIISSSIDDNEDKFKVTFIDIDNSDIKKKDMVSFINSNKVLDKVLNDRNIKKNDDISDDVLDDLKRISYRNQDIFYGLKNRSTTKIGRIVGKLYPSKYKQSGEPGKDIESFVNMYKASRDTSDFEIVKGEDIKFWYNENQYLSGGGPLNNSCMRYEKCEDYLDFYVDNKDKISLVILKDSENNKKIKGRALLWELDSPSGRTFMDRIYTVNDSDIILFKDYATEKGWIYKNYQNMSEDGNWTDTKTGEEIYVDLILTDLYDPEDGHYPYCDTMKYFDGDTISNSIDNIDISELKKLEDTSGGFTGGEYSDFYDEYINPEANDMQWCDRGDGYRYEDDCFYSEYYGESIANDYAENNMVELDHYDHYDYYREEGDYITTYEGNTCDEDYASNNFAYSQYSDAYLEDSVYSEYHDDSLPEDESVSVWTDVEQSNSDYRIDGDGNYWTWDHDGEYYDDDITEEELREYNNLDDGDE